MTALKPITREYRIYLALWRKAFHSKEPVTFKASNFAMAVAIRQGMYRAIKPFRYGELNDLELKDAAERFVIYLTKTMDGKKHLKDQPHWIELKQRQTLKEMNRLFDELEIDEDDLFLGEEKAISNKLKELMEKPKKVSKSKTPFYSRDD